MFGRSSVSIVARLQVFVCGIGTSPVYLSAM